MDIRFILQPRYSSSVYIAGPFNLYGYTSGSATPNLLAGNVTKDALLLGVTVTTQLDIVSGYIESLGDCSSLPPELYSLEFSPGPIIIGTFQSYSDVSSIGIVKLNNSGVIDTTFNTGQGFGLNGGAADNGGPVAISKQTNGQIVVGGPFSSFDGVACPGLVRLNPDGSKDYSFSPPSSFLGMTILAIACLPNGQIVVGGSDAKINAGNPSTRDQAMLYRLNFNGSIDASFQAAGTLGGGSINGVIKVILPLPDNNILVAGGFISPGDGIMKLDINGTRDTAFAGSLPSTSQNSLGDVECMILDNSQNNVFIGGSFTRWVDAGVPMVGPIKIDLNGNRDNSFAPYVNGTVTSMAQESTGRIVIGGSFTSVGYGGAAVTKYNIVRVLAGGTIDSTFGGTGLILQNQATTAWFPTPKLAILSDGDILVTGNITNSNGTAIKAVAKIKTSNGLNNTSFSSGAQAPGFTSPYYNGLVIV
jgi:uncharacterized delta-60 repeat protein